MTNPHGLNLRLRLKEFISALGFYDFLLLNSLLVIIVSGIFYKAIQRSKLEKFLLPLVVAEMFIVAQGMLPLTYVRTNPPSAAQRIINQQPAGYPLPDMQKSIADFSADGMQYFDIVGCFNPYNKLPGRSDYIITPANLSTQAGFWDSVSLRKKIITYPLAYFADTVYALKDTAAFIATGYNGKVAIATPKDSLPFLPNDSSNTIRIKRFSPGHFLLETDTKNPALLVFMQNNYPGWTATVNGQSTRLYTANRTFLAVTVPAGNATIEFVYKTGRLKLLSVIAVLFILGGLLYIYILQKKKS